MDFITVFLIAISLAMDAFAVSVIGGATIKNLDGRTYFRLSFHFGLFQFGMPVIGWFLSRSFVDHISSYSGIIAFVLLLGIGSKMIWEAFQGDEESYDQDISRGMKMVSLSIATSIDALAIGITLGLMGVHFLYPSLVIGVVASVFSIFGIIIGRKTGHFFGSKIYILGGIILIGIGLKNLFY